MNAPHHHPVLIVLLLALLLGGCNFYGTTPAPPPQGLPEYFTGPSVPGPVTSADWWTLFGDPELDRLVDEAFAHNLDLAQAVARLRQAEALLSTANAARLPSLTGNGELRRAEQPGVAGDVDGSSRTLSLAAAFEIDLFGKLAARSRGAAADLAASRAEVKTVLLTLAARVADAYYLVIEQRGQLALAMENIAAYRDALAMVERRYRAGLVPAVDLYSARLNLAAADAAQAATASALRQAEHALAVLVGRYPGGAIAGELAVLPPPPDQFPAGLPSELLRRRPDLEAALARVAAADARRAAAIADRFPSFNLLGSYGTSRTDLSGPLLAGDFWSLAGGVALPLFDGGRRRAEVARQEALLDEALARYRQTVLVAFQEVEDALVRNANDQQRLDSLLAAEAAAEAALRLATERYRQGLSEYLPVLTAQIFHAQAKSNLQSARRQLLADRISLARALGGDWLQAASTRTLNRTEDATP